MQNSVSAQLFARKLDSRADLFLRDPPCPALRASNEGSRLGPMMATYLRLDVELTKTIRGLFEIIFYGGFKDAFTFDQLDTHPGLL